MMWSIRMRVLKLCDAITKRFAHLHRSGIIELAAQLITIACHQLSLPIWRASHRIAGTSLISFSCMLISPENAFTTRQQYAKSFRLSSLFPIVRHMRSLNSRCSNQHLKFHSGNMANNGDKEEDDDSQIWRLQANRLVCTARLVISCSLTPHSLFRLRKFSTFICEAKCFRLNLDFVRLFYWLLCNELNLVGARFHFF